MGSSNFIGLCITVALFMEFDSKLPRIASSPGQVSPMPLAVMASATIITTA